jgi:broad specificity phosphatase PhoE
MREDERHATKVMLIRHAEKPQTSSDLYGVTAEGHRDKESLTVRGWQRAGALAHLFAPAAGRFEHRSLAQPDYLFASKARKQNGSRRSVETITPLAEKLAIRINSNFTKSEYEEMLDEALACAGVVLISWQHEYLPQIANHILGDEKTAPQEWPGDRFDVIWVLDRRPASGRYRFAQVPQLLLMGDWATPIR